MTSAAAPRPFFQLTPEDGPPFEHYGAGRKSRWLVVCDHASNRIPACLGDMGLSEAQRGEHFAYDIGTDGLSRALADLLGAPALISRFSRLVIDLNRVPTHPTLCTPHEDETDIPANIGLDDAQKQARIEQIYQPYHDAVAAALNEIKTRGEEPVLLSVHSFVPQYRKGEFRPWHIGVLWREDQRLSVPFIEALRTRGDLVVGDNQPYDRRDYRTQTVEFHAEDNGILNLLIEVRHDMIRSERDQKEWADIVFGALPGVI